MAFWGNKVYSPGTSGQFRCLPAEYGALFNILDCMRYFVELGDMTQGARVNWAFRAEARWGHLKRYRPFGIAFFLTTLLLKTRDVL